MNTAKVKRILGQLVSALYDQGCFHSLADAKELCRALEEWLPAAPPVCAVCGLPPGRCATIGGGPPAAEEGTITAAQVAESRARRGVCADCGGSGIVGHFGEDLRACGCRLPAGARP